MTVAARELQARWGGEAEKENVELRKRVAELVAERDEARSYPAKRVLESVKTMTRPMLIDWLEREANNSPEQSR